ncbi:hypothetical protein D3C81_962560 [compost metagenome]
MARMNSTTSCSRVTYAAGEKVAGDVPSVTPWDNNAPTYPAYQAPVGTSANCAAFPGSSLKPITRQITLANSARVILLCGLKLPSL